MQSKEKLIILSDLWGTKNAEWINFYFSHLENHFDIEFLDSCVLGKIDLPAADEKIRHQQFVSSGIDEAVSELKKQKNTSHILGFSVGGTIAWKANRSGLNAEKLFLISATRIRYENEKPAGEIHLVFGGDDSFKPDAAWFQKMDLPVLLFQNEGHDCYRQEEYARRICELIAANK